MELETDVLRVLFEEKVGNGTVLAQAILSFFRDFYANFQNLKKRMCLPIPTLFEELGYNQHLKPAEIPGYQIEISKLELSIDQILDLNIIEESLVSRIVIKQQWRGVDFFGENFR